MAEANVTTPAPRKRRRWLRTLVWIAGTLVALLVVLYFVVTSSGFVTGFILPRVSKSINAHVTVSRASVKPFSEVIFHDLKVQPLGHEPVFTAKEIRARYSLFKIIGGTIKVSELAVVSPTINLIQQADGSSNLDPILRALESKEEPKERKEPSEPGQLDIGHVLISEGTFRAVKHYDASHSDLTEVTGLQVEVNNLRNGQAGTLNATADMSMNSRPPAPAAAGQLSAKLTSQGKFSMSPELRPSSIDATANVTVLNAAEALADLATLAVDFNAQVTPQEIKQIALRFQRGQTPLGEIFASGPLSLEKMEGRVNVEVRSIDQRLLNLFGAASGLDFGSTTISSTNAVELKDAGNSILAAGQFNIGKLQVKRANQVTPVLDALANYDVAVDRTAGAAVIQGLTISGTQNQKPLFQGKLSSPMTLAWGNANNAVGDSALELTLTALNLADWKPFVGDALDSGLVDARINLLSQQGGKLLNFEADSKIDNLTAGAGENRIVQALVELKARGDARDFKQFNLANCSLQVSRQGQALVSASAAGTYDTAAQKGKMGVKLEAALARLLAAMPRPDMKASSGTIELRGQVTKDGEAQAITGAFTLASFTGRLGEREFRDYGATADLDVSKDAETIHIRKAAGKLTQGANAGGSFDVSGSHGLTGKPTKLSVKLSDFNQHGLRPFLEPMLANKQLVSVSLNSDTLLQYDPRGASSLEGSVDLANLVVTDPQQPAAAPGKPLEAKMKIDAAIDQKTADIKQLQITLTPTVRARNELNFQGRLDISQTNAMQGTLKLACETLDVTSYYDLFVGKEPEPKQAGGATTPAAPPPSAPRNQEPDPVNLPFRNLMVNADVGKFYLRDIVVSDLRTTVKVDGGHVLLDPFQLTLNGAPVKARADLDLSVPGYRYDVMFDASRVSIVPIIDSFSPTYRGRAKGDLSANLQLKGAGTLGVNLQRSLVGEASLLLTNANIQAIGPKMRRVIVPIATALRIPELADSPITWMAAEVKAGGGKINLTQFRAIAPAYTAKSQGTITIAPVLGNSTYDNLPVELALAHSLVQQARLNIRTDPNSSYADLGVIAHVRGTVDDPDPKVDTIRLTLLVGQSYIPGQAGDVLRQIPNVFGPGRSTQTNTPATTTTNAPPRRRSVLDGILDAVPQPK